MLTQSIPLQIHSYIEVNLYTLMTCPIYIYTALYLHCYKLYSIILLHLSRVIALLFAFYYPPLYSNTSATHANIPSYVSSDTF